MPRNFMAQLAGCLWKLNLVRVIVVDVTDDYTLMQPPMPSDYYPVLSEVWLPRYKLGDKLPKADLVSGYLYDWHETPIRDDGHWYVGVVDASMAVPPLASDGLVPDALSR
jgi:hypothetical protein